MKTFIVEAYGAHHAADGPVRHFTVQADTREAAIAMVKQSWSTQVYSRFDAVEEIEESDEEAPGILDEGPGPYRGEKLS